MRFPILLAFSLSLCSILALDALAGGDAPSKTRKDEVLEADGTNVRGQSGDFAEYLNEADEEKESNSVELMRISEDAKVDVDGQDGVGVKFGY